nr:hypothetical protein [uncultured Ruminococcus sp.]
MKDYSELSKWLQDDITKPAAIRNGDYADTIIRVPYDDDFDFLFHQNSYNGEPLTVNANMAYCGIYNKLDGQLYDVKFPLKGKLDDMDSTKSMLDIEQQFNDDVRAFIEGVVGNDVDHLRSPSFEDAKYDNRLDDFRRNYADSIVTRMYLGGDSADDIRFQCGYYLDRSSSALMLRYLKYHDATVEEAATGYWQTHQDDMLLELRKNEILREKLRVLEANPNHPLHKQKAVMDAVKDSGAKTVNVTIIKGGEEYSFKYSADRLSRYMEGKYSAWDMPSKDRDGFYERFGRYSDFTPEDITEISYRGKTLYEADSLMPSESADEDFSDDMDTEDEDEGFSMSM